MPNARCQCGGRGYRNPPWTQPQEPCHELTWDQGQKQEPSVHGRHLSPTNGRPCRMTRGLLPVSWAWYPYDKPWRKGHSAPHPVPWFPRLSYMSLINTNFMEPKKQRAFRWISDCLNLWRICKIKVCSCIDSNAFFDKTWRILFQESLIRKTSKSSFINRHLILGKSSCLIRADNRRCTSRIRPCRQEAWRNARCMRSRTCIYQDLFPSGSSPHPRGENPRRWN